MNWNESVAQSEGTQLVGLAQLSVRLINAAGY